MLGCSGKYRVRLVICTYFLQKHDVTHEVAGSNAFSAVAQQVLTLLLIQL